MSDTIPLRPENGEPTKRTRSRKRTPAEAPPLRNLHKLLNGNRLRFIPLDRIEIDEEQQIQRYIDPEKLQALVAVIQENSFLENILVKPHPQKEGYYKLIDGKRNILAAREAGAEEAPAIVLEADQTKSLVIALQRYFTREHLNPIDETDAILQLLCLKLDSTADQVILKLYRLKNEAEKALLSEDDESRGNVSPNLMAEEISKLKASVEGVFREIGNPFTWETFIRTRLKLLRLPEPILKAIRGGQIEYTKALTINKVKDEGVRDQLLQEAIEKGLTLSQIKAQVEELQPEREITTDRVFSYRLSEIRKRLRASHLKRTQLKKINRLLGELEEIVGIDPSSSLEALTTAERDAEESSG